MTRTPRRAFTLIEMTIAATLLGILFAALGQFLSRWEAARRATNDRSFALRTLENVLERDAVRVVDAESISADLNAEGRLKSPQFELTHGATDDRELVPVTVSLSWQNAQGQRVSPVTLTAWKRGGAPRESSP
jgi:prepilin-type N-terminal cleavage/methylation domain-containing protein